MAILEKRADAGLDTQDIATIRKFMEEDDGKEFLMANLIEMNASPRVSVALVLAFGASILYLIIG